MDITLARTILHQNRRSIGVCLYRLGKIKRQPELFGMSERGNYIEALRTAYSVIRKLKEVHPEIFDTPARQLKLF